jgi:hypothetical protein
MPHTTQVELDRRQFIQHAGLVTGIGLGASLSALARVEAISIISDPEDKIVSTPPVQWAINRLQTTLTGRGIKVKLARRLTQTDDGDLCIQVAAVNSPQATRILQAGGASVPRAAEALGLIPGRSGDKPLLLACGRDARGLVYALLELTDRAQLDPDPIKSLQPWREIVERPANRIRCISRAFCSDVEDLGWFNDREMWAEYLTMLATQRFNRFNLTLGLAYDFNVNVTDCYFHFAYPFLVSVPGYEVRAAGLPDKERDSNLEVLRYISDQAALRGLEFNLGIWTHAYKWTDSPDANYTISGLTPENHGPYCRDALQMILEKCPGITGTTIRIHGESGVKEGSYDFWKTVFDGVVRSGRKIEIDLHSKGMDQEMIDTALATNLPVVIAPKYWAEHMGLPYHQTAIRELERRPREGNEFFSISGGARRFTRYGYADLLKEDRRYGVLYRMFPGARRVMLWGDPLTAAGYGRISHFCDSDGVDLMEPMYFKGRRGSGVAGDRCSYEDPSLRPRWDWEKFRYTYRVWGRLLYNPSTDPAPWRRYLKEHYGDAAPAAEQALGKATRLLQIVCTVHGVSAAHNRYWPEMYTNMSIVDPEAYNPYGDTPEPKLFGTVSPFDPQLFLTIDESAAEMLTGKRTGKYSQIEAAQWLEDLASDAERSLMEATRKLVGQESVRFRRLAIDTAMQIGLGRFFASKIRSAALWAIYVKSSDRTALQEAVKQYQKARTAWVGLAQLATGVYMSNVAYGEHKFLQGHWQDRIPAIDEDIARMEKGEIWKEEGGSWMRRGTEVRLTQYVVQGAITEATGRPERVTVPCGHTEVRTFPPGQPLSIRLSVPSEQAGQGLSVWLQYRHVNQAEVYVRTAMDRSGTTYTAEIPAEYTNSPYPLQYYFELRNDQDQAWLYPGFAPDLANQPYFVARHA